MYMYTVTVVSEAILCSWFIFAEWALFVYKAWERGHVNDGLRLGNDHVFTCIQHVHVHVRVQWL